MADKFEELSEEHISFIEKQAIFFVGTAPESGRINVSPKGMDTFRVVDKNRICWLNLTGSGNETAAHLKGNSRMTIMFCSFSKIPLILRLYGQATTFHNHDKEWSDYLGLFPDYPGARQIFLLDVDLVQNSCGFAVPKMDLVEDRSSLVKWAKSKGDEGIREYWDEKNKVSLDGLETGIFKETCEAD